jgi:hypothetical protein
MANETISQYPLSKEIPSEFWPLLEQTDGAPKVILKLKEEFLPNEIAIGGKEQRAWECMALFYRDTRRLHQAIQTIAALYDQMLAYQEITKKRIHKGMPLVWLRDFHLGLNHLATAKRYAMLTLCEDAIREKGILDAQQGGTYFRLAFQHGMADVEIQRYAKAIFELSQKNPEESLFPEWLLQDIDNDWMVECPTLTESFIYVPNLFYIRHLLNLVREPTGLVLERLAGYILSVIPGFRTYRRQLTPSSDYDIICSIEGLHMDFRAELGRYLVCECKDWAKRAVDFSAIAKFCRVLDSAKCRSGIVFSEKGISGIRKNTLEDAALERVKVFQDRGTVILVVDRRDLEAVAIGKNFIALLRSKYEQVRLDLVRTQETLRQERPRKKAKKISEN